MAEWKIKAHCQGRYIFIKAQSTSTDKRSKRSKSLRIWSPEISKFPTKMIPAKLQNKSNSSSTKEKMKWKECFNVVISSLQRPDSNCKSRLSSSTSETFTKESSTKLSMEWKKTKRLSGCLKVSYLTETTSGAKSFKRIDKPETGSKSFKTKWKVTMKGGKKSSTRNLCNISELIRRSSCNGTERSKKTEKRLLTKPRLSSTPRGNPRKIWRTRQPWRDSRLWNNRIWQSISSWLRRLRTTRLKNCWARRISFWKSWEPRFWFRREVTKTKVKKELKSLKTLKKICSRRSMPQTMCITTWHIQ